MKTWQAMQRLWRLPASDGWYRLENVTQNSVSRKSLCGAEWLAVLRRLAERLDPQAPTKLIVIGGAALALAYGARRSTQDVDAILDPRDASRVLQLADNIGVEFGLLSGWLNENAKNAGFLVDTILEGAVVLKMPALEVVTPSIEQLTAMKLAAIRGQTDVDDALFLLRRLPTSGLDAEEIWALVGGLLPVAERDKARYNLLRLWEMVNEPT